MALPTCRLALGNQNSEPSLLGLLFLEHCRYLGDEDDGVSEAIVPFAVQYIGILKGVRHIIVGGTSSVSYHTLVVQHSNLSDTDRTNLRGVLDAVISKLKYDESYDFECEGEDEIMFLEFRKQLKVLLEAVAQVVCELLHVNGCVWYSRPPSSPFF